MRLPKSPPRKLRELDKQSGLVKKPGHREVNIGCENTIADIVGMSSFPQSPAFQNSFIGEFSESRGLWPSFPELSDLIGAAVAGLLPDDRISVGGDRLKILFFQIGVRYGRLLRRGSQPLVK
jgi:hypothetical protein